MIVKKGVSFFVLFLLIVCGCFSCADIPNEASRGARSGKKKAVEGSTVEAKISDVIMKKAAYKYYKYPQKTIINVYINDIGGDNKYLYEREYVKYSVAKLLNKATQIKVVTELNNEVDCIVEMRHENISNIDKIYMDMIDTAGAKTFYTDSFVFNGASGFDATEFSSFRNVYDDKVKRENIIGSTKFKIVVNTKGNSADEASDYWLVTRTTRFSERTYIVEEKFDDSKIYPEDIRITLDDKVYKLYEGPVIYDAPIYPGKHNIKVSFKEGLYDGRERRRLIGKTIQKEFNVNINKNEDVAFEILLVCNEKISFIKAKAYKKKTKSVDGDIPEQYEVIENFM